MKKKSVPAPLTFYQYVRIYRTIQGISEFFTKNVGRECVLFSVLGAALMHKHYGKDAKVICGLGAVVVHNAETPVVLSWCEEEDQGKWSATRDTFHTWVECDGWAIDFMAPNYPEAFRSSPRAACVSIPTIPRKMLQKHMEKVQGPLDDLTRTGHAVLLGDYEITTAVIDHAFEGSGIEDIFNIALAWHRPLPGAMGSTMAITNDLGELSTLRLSPREVVGAW